MFNLHLENVSFSYKEGDFALKNISFSLEDHDFLCVFGASGSGKTTLLKVIAGLFDPQKGTIELHHEMLSDIPSHKRKIGYVFQEPKLYPHLTIYENLMLGIKHSSLSFSEKDQLIKNRMKAFHLLPFMNIKPKYLSLGEQEKVALAKVFLVQEDLYLFDEAMSGLDALSRKKVLRYINKIRDENHAPMIYVTHDEENIPSFTTKVLILKDGEILFFNTLDEMLLHPTHIDVLNYTSERYNHLPIKVIDQQIYYDQQPIASCTLNDGEYILSLPISNFSLTKEDTFSLLHKKSYLDRNGKMILEGYCLGELLLIPLSDEEEINENQLHFIFHTKNGFIFALDGRLKENL